MSRRTLFSENRKYEVAFGHDHANGFFIQVWDLEKDANGDIKEDPIVDYDDGPFLGGCDAKKVKDTALIYGVIITESDLQTSQAKTPRRDMNKHPFGKLLSVWLKEGLNHE